MKCFLALLPLLALATGSEWYDGDCGSSNFEGNPNNVGRIVGGQEAVPNEFPWQVLMLKSGSFACGGIVISNKWVMTAAHCVGYTTTGIELYAGRHTLCTRTSCKNEASEQKSTVKRVLRHEQYNSWTMNNDIALLELTTPYRLNKEVVAACRPTPGKSYAGVYAWVSGWGTTRSGGRVAQELRYVGVPVLSNSECNTSPKLKGSITESMLCAGELPEHNYDACQGDSGGPLVTRRADGKYEVVGVVSWGYGCASGDPGVYARVPHLIGWVDEKIRTYGK